MQQNKTIGQVYRGELYYANLFGATGSEQAGKRPVLVVQNNIGNEHSTTIIILPLTKKLDIISSQPTHINIDKMYGLEFESTILAEQIRTIDKERLYRKIGSLPHNIMEKVDYTMKIALGIKDK